MSDTNNLPTDAGAVDAEIADIEAEMQDTKGDYYRDTDKQARYRALIEAKEVGGSVPAAPDPRAARRVEIEKLMADGHSDYWRGPNSEKLQSEYRSLISDGPPTASDTDAPAGDDWRSSPAQFAAAQPTLATEWGEAGDLDSRLSRAQDVARAALDGVDDAETRADLVTSFNGLSEGTQAAILGELSMPSPGYIKEASAAEIELFRETPEGDDLVREWGGYNSNKAARHVGAIRSRMRAAVDRMSKADRAEFGTWYDGLSEAEARAALTALVA